MPFPFQSFSSLFLSNLEALFLGLETVQSPLDLVLSDLFLVKLLIHWVDYEAFRSVASSFDL
jgi:hypothetical protein